MSNPSESECPKCKKNTRRKSKSWFKHIYLSFKGSNRRYCSNCRIKWHIIAPPSIALKATFIMSGIVVAIVIVVQILSSFDPVAIVKRSVVSSYKKNEGSNAKKEIKKDFGHLYKTDNAAKNDFKAHEK